MNIEYRKYNKSDYQQCEEHVNKAWGFDQMFQSTNLQAIAKKLYTKGSLASSNYQMVAVCEGEVVGFIFGFNKTKRKPKWGILLGLKATFDLNTKKMDKAERQQFTDAIVAHHKNRQKVQPDVENEIVLFVVKDTHQGMGIGRKLWDGFMQFCKNSEQTTIRVETNKAGASTFYEMLGFKHQIDFNSPLHELGTPNGQACIYTINITK